MQDAEAGRWQINWIGFKTDDYTKECNKIPHVPRFGFGTSVLWSEEEHDHSKFIKNDIMTTDGKLVQHHSITARQHSLHRTQMTDPIESMRCAPLACLPRRPSSLCTKPATMNE